MRRFLILPAILLATLPAFAAEIASSVDAGALPGAKTTPQGLYLTPQDAQAALTDDPSIVFIDVRDPIEIMYVGHPEGIDAIVPLELTGHAFDERAGAYKSDDNPDFVAEVGAAVARAGGDPAAPVFLICRSGNRSATGARQLAAAGYTNVWTIVEGFEGDKDEATGARSRNGWRNAGLPWAWRIDSDAAWQPSAR